MTPTWDEPSSNPVLGLGHVHIWYCDFHHTEDFGLAKKCLSEDEHGRALRFKVEDARLIYVGSHILLRHVLAKYLDAEPKLVAFRADTRGKPYLSGDFDPDDLQFNLSHSHGNALCAVTRGIQVGIDIERINPDLCEESIAERVFSETELTEFHRLQASQRPVAFFRLWTRKEAYAKCLGLGMSADFKHIELGFSEADCRFEGVEVRSFDCPDGYIGSVAVAKPAGEVRFFRWSLETNIQV